MVVIAPFKPLRYTGNLEGRTTPPHDCISPEEAAEFRMNSDNICNVILPVGEKPFENANKILQEWIDDGTMARDAKSAFYLYEVNWNDGKNARQMLGLFCRIRIDPTYTEIRRHELTLKKKKKERFELQIATKTNTESIWLLYRDERAWVEEILTSNAFDEVSRVKDEAGIEHVLWRVDRPEAVTEVIAQFEDRTVVIADGHHRYQTALDVFEKTEREGDQSLLVCLVRDQSSGLKIEPTHRLLHTDIPELEVEEVLAKNWVAGNIVPVSPDGATKLRAWADANPTGFVLLRNYGKPTAQLYTLKKELLAEEKTHLSKLTVSRAHTFFIDAIGCTEPGESWTYTRTNEEAVDAILKKSCRFVVVLGPEQVSSVLDVAAEGNVMPQKSTFFVPKLRSGLVLGPCDEPAPKPWQELAGDPGRKKFSLPDLS